MKRSAKSEPITAESLGIRKTKSRSQFTFRVSDKGDGAKHVVKAISLPVVKHFYEGV